jgi:hypothetical protein
MKKVNLLTVIVLAVVCLQNSSAQPCGGPPVLSENFNNGMPGSWTILDLDGNPLKWSMYSKGFTGAWQSYVHDGQKCAAVCDYFDGGTYLADDYLISPSLTLGTSPVCLSWKATMGYDPYINSYSVLVSTTGTDPADFAANPPLFVQPAEGAVWTEYNVDLSAYAGQTIYIAFHDDNISQGGYALFIDDINITQPVLLDMSAAQVDFGEVLIAGSYPVAGKIYNGGTGPVNSMDINWQVDNGPVQTMNVSGQNILPSSYFDFVHAASWAPSSNGTYTLKLWAANLNGQGDQYTGNDTLSKILFVNNFPRKVLIEEYTQASCPPCATQNPDFDDLLYQNRLTGKVTAIKYHTIWPGYDPMNTINVSQVEERVIYYGVLGVPSAFYNGRLTENCPGSYPGAPACLTQYAIDSSVAVPTIFQIQINPVNYGTAASVNITVTSKTDFPLSTFTLYTAVVEDTIDYGTPPGTNGESVFYQVFRTMLPDYDGEPLPAMTNNQSLNFNFGFPVLLAYNPGQLKVVCFIQDEVTKKVYQSEMTENPIPLGLDQNLPASDNIIVSPNPAKDKITIRMNSANRQNLFIILNDITGKEISSENQNIEPGLFEETYELKNLAKGSYYFRLISDQSVVMKKFIRE